MAWGLATTRRVDGQCRVDGVEVDAMIRHEHTRVDRPHDQRLQHPQVLHERGDSYHWCCTTNSVRACVEIK